MGTHGDSKQERQLLQHVKCVPMQYSHLGTHGDRRKFHSKKFFGLAMSLLKKISRLRNESEFEKWKIGGTSTEESGGQPERSAVNRCKISFFEIFVTQAHSVKFQKRFFGRNFGSLGSLSPCCPHVGPMLSPYVSPYIPLLSPLSLCICL